MLTFEHMKLTGDRTLTDDALDTKSLLKAMKNFKSH